MLQRSSLRGELPPLLSLLAAYWLYRVYGVPFWARSRGPFARAWRALRGAERGGADAASVQSAMRQLHCAFDATFGKTVFRDQIDAFLAQHPRYATQREPIERFFELSRRAFYANSTSGDIVLGDLRSLAHRLSLVERGLT